MQVILSGMGKTIKINSSDLEDYGFSQHLVERLEENQINSIRSMNGRFTAQPCRTGKNKKSS
jgi:hypothetical protein